VSTFVTQVNMKITSPKKKYFPLISYLDEMPEKYHNLTLKKENKLKNIISI
jgi:hypothetical protein